MMEAAEAERRGGAGRRKRPSSSSSPPRNRHFQTLLPPLIAGLFVLLACAALPAARAALLAIDFGSENLKMCLVKPGRTPISIVVNEFSRRKSPALVGVIGGDRVVGEEGSTMAVKRPTEVFLRTRDLLGRRADDPFLREMIRAHLLPYELAPHPRRAGAAALVATPGALEAGNSSSSSSSDNSSSGPLMFPAEELVASVLQYAREAAEIYAGGGSAGGGGKEGASASSPGGGGAANNNNEGRVVDTVIAVPAWWGLEQRRALADAASLAGLNVLALINGHSAAALQYGIERDFSGGKEKEQLVLLFDVGAGSTEAALVRFSSYSEGRLPSSQKHVSQFEVLDAEWDAGAGANDLDALLMRRFAGEFDEKHPPSSSSSSSSAEDGGVLSSPKAVAKLRKQARRTKEILSANAHAPFSAEELHRGVDFSASVSRDELERLAAPWFARVAAVAERLLARNGVSAAKDLSAVELLGGGSRVPALQAALSKALGGRALDRHLDADEAIALGAGLFAANLSSTFRLRKFGMADAAPYGVEFESLDLELPAGEIGGAAAAGGNSAADANASAEADADDQRLKGESSDAESAGDKAGAPVVRALLPPGKRLPARRAVKFHNLTADAFSFSLRYNASSPRGLPPGVSDPLLARYSVSGIRRAVERYGSSGATTLRFEADHGGRVELASAECVVEREEPEQRRVLDEEAWEKAVAAATADAARRAAEDGARIAKEEDEAKKAKAAEEAAKEKETKADKEGAKEQEEEGKKEEEEGGEKREEKNKDDDKAASPSSPPPPPPKSSTTPRNLTAEYVAAAISGLERPMKNVTFMRKRTYRVALDVAPALGGGAEQQQQRQGDTKEAAAGKTAGATAPAATSPLAVAAAWARPPLLGEALDEARATVDAWRARDLKKREAAKARNDLEAHVIATREALGEEGGGEGEDGGGSGGGSDDGSDGGDESSSALRRASTPAERAALREALVDAEDWLYSDEGGRAGADDLRARLAELRALGAAAAARATELVARPAKVRAARAFLAEARADAASWAESKPWITTAEAKKAAAALDALDKWLSAHEAGQAKRKASEAGAFSSADVEAREAEAAAAFRAVADKPKPAEKKAAKKKEDAKKQEEMKEEDKKKEEEKEEAEKNKKEADAKAPPPPHEEL